MKSNVLSPYTGKIRVKTELRIYLDFIFQSLPSSPLFNLIRTKYFQKFYNINQKSVLFRGVELKGNVQIGKNCLIRDNCVIASTSPGKITIGDFTILAPDCYLRNSDHGFESINTPIRFQQKLVSDISIGEDCWLAHGVKVLKGVIIGNGCVIGAGSVVTKDIPSYSLAIGAPAKVIKRRDKL
jgi:acetyltransferase-like isoleucine patch superfamily enzyme